MYFLRFPAVFEPSYPTPIDPCLSIYILLFPHIPYCLTAFLCWQRQQQQGSVDMDMPRKDPLFPGMPPPLPHPSFSGAVAPSPLLRPGESFVVGAVGGVWRASDDGGSAVGGVVGRERQVGKDTAVCGVRRWFRLCGLRLFFLPPAGRRRRATAVQSA